MPWVSSELLYLSHKVAEKGRRIWRKGDLRQHWEMELSPSPDLLRAGTLPERRGFLSGALVAGNGDYCVGIHSVRFDVVKAGTGLIKARSHVAMLAFFPWAAKTGAPPWGVRCPPGQRSVDFLALLGFQVFVSSTRQEGP